MCETSTYPLRLPRSIKSAVEKLAVMNTANSYAERKGRADLKAFRRLLSRMGGDRPRAGDET